VVFFSGHGLLDTQVSEEGRKDGDPRGYLAPIDCDPSSPEALEKTGIAIDDLLGRMAGCKAENRVLLVDACHSGAIRVEQLNTVFKTARGVVTLASCQSGETSREDPDLGHGVFSALMLDALSGAADANLDGVVRFDELHNYLYDQSKGTGQTPALFHPPSVPGQPAVLALSGPAARLTAAKAAAAQREYERAFETVRSLGRLDDPRLEIERIELADLCASKAAAVYRNKAGDQFEKLRAGINASEPGAVRRAFRCALALASDDLGTGNKARFQENIDTAQTLLASVSDPSAFIDDSVALAEVMQQVQTAVGFDALREKYSKAIRPALLAADARQRRLRDPRALQGARAVLAGACWRLAVDDLWKFYTGTVIETYSPDTLWHHLALCEAHALARNPEGALKSALEIDRLKPLEPTEQPKAALAFALAARSAAHEFSRSAVRQNLTGIFSQAESRAVELLRAAGVTPTAAAGDGPKAVGAAAAPAGPAPAAAVPAAPAAVGNVLSDWNQVVILILTESYALMGRFADAQTWSKRLPAGSAIRGKAVAAIALAQARLGFPDEARQGLEAIDVPDLPERLDVCRAVAQAEAMGRQERLNDLLDWIENPSKGGQPLRPEEVVCAYAGLVDGLNKKPWTRLAINSPDLLQIRFDPNGNPLVVSSDTEAQARAVLPASPNLRPMANDPRAVAVSSYLDRSTDVMRSADYSQLGQLGQVLNGIQQLESGAQQLRGLGVPVPSIPYAGMISNPASAIPSIPYVGGLGGFGGFGGFR
jgi:hypothetical protein